MVDANSNTEVLVSRATNGDAGGVVWVTDFGLAKTDDEAMTRTGDILGTMRYMSPERFRGQCDVRADVYSLGLTLYELLVLKPAFESPDRPKLIEMVRQSEPSTPRAIDPRIPRDLKTTVHCRSPPIVTGWPPRVRIKKSDSGSRMMGTPLAQQLS